MPDPALNTEYDVCVIGAGAAGLFCAIEAGWRGRSVCVIDHAKRPAEKIRISGGGRCNFTNIHASAANFLSDNPHFCKSALKRYTAQDFLARVEGRNIAWHEKTLGQLFCDTSATEIIAMLLDDCESAGVDIRLQTHISDVSKPDERFRVETSRGTLSCESLVMASGGLSIPKMGATGFAHDVARQFGLNIVRPRPGLVPFTFQGAALEPIRELAGVSVEARVACEAASFDEAMLYTHRGLSGPAILQVSSYWRGGEEVVIDLARGEDALARLKTARGQHPKQILPTVLSTFLPKRLAQVVADDTYGPARLADLSDVKLNEVAARVHAWRTRPDGTEGYRTAEVTVGGVSTADLSSKTMEAAKVPGLYFIGEAVDVTGWLGGYNFQWAWSSGWVAGQNA